MHAIPYRKGGATMNLGYLKFRVGSHEKVLRMEYRSSLNIMHAFLGGYGCGGKG